MRPTVIRDDRQALNMAMLTIRALQRINDDCRAGKARVHGPSLETVRAYVPRLERYVTETVDSDLHNMGLCDVTTPTEEQP